MAVSGFYFGGEIADALGLKDITHLELIFPLEGYVEIRATMRMGITQFDNVKTLLTKKRYHLVEVDDTDEAGDVAWQCDNCGELLEDDTAHICPLCHCRNLTVYEPRPPSRPRGNVDVARWQCNECGEIFYDSGLGKCPFCR